MTDRDELIVQLARALGGDFAEGRGAAHWQRLAAGVVDAGWRPPVEGDAIEKLARLVHAMDPWAMHERFEDEGPHYREVAEAADAADLLRAAIPSEVPR